MKMIHLCNRNSCANILKSRRVYFSSCPQIKSDIEVLPQSCKGMVSRVSRSSDDARILIGLRSLVCAVRRRQMQCHPSGHYVCQLPQALRWAHLMHCLIWVHPTTKRNNTLQYGFRTPPMQSDWMIRGSPSPEDRIAAKCIVFWLRFLFNTNRLSVSLSVCLI